MSTANMLYLLMCLAMFGAFSATLAYYSRHSTKTNAPEKLAAPANLINANGTVTL